MRAYWYGFNGHEKDNEVSGAGNSYTAEFWQYNSRLGRRFNVDPVVKSWFSPYVAFRNSPLIFIDPKGDDDIFSRDGKFLGSTATGNLIRVVNEGTVMDQAIENLAKSSTVLTDMEFPQNDKQARGMLVLITGHYAAQVGITDPVVISRSSKEGVGASYSGQSDEYFIHVNSETNKINSHFGDINNLKNSWAHEKEHDDNPKSHTSLFHPEAILAQVGHESWENTTKPFKQSALAYAGGLLQQAIDEGHDISDVQGMIDRLNASDLSKVGSLSIEENKVAVTFNFLESDDD